jgi:hypothetical protein
VRQPKVWLERFNVTIIYNGGQMTQPFSCLSLDTVLISKIE